MVKQFKYLRALAQQHKDAASATGAADGTSANDDCVVSGNVLVEAIAKMVNTMPKPSQKSPEQSVNGDAPLPDDDPDPFAFGKMRYDKPKISG